MGSCHPLCPVNKIRSSVFPATPHHRSMNPNEQASPNEAAPVDPILRNSLDLTISVPCKNEEKNIVGTLDTIVSAVNHGGCPTESNPTDDRATDQTSELV